MTGWSAKGAARLPLRCTRSARNVALATLTFLVASVTLAQSSMPGASVAPNASKAPAAAALPPAPLPVDTAFPLSASFDKRGNVALKIDVLPGHYLYRERFEFSLDGKPGYSLDQFKAGKNAVGKTKNDAHFGAVNVFDAPLSLQVGRSAQPKTALVVTYQGCSELAGICYPPVRRTFDLYAGASEIAANEAPKSMFGNQFKKNVSQ